MKLVEFPQVNLRIAEDQDEYETLPCYKFGNDPQGHIVCCWELSFRERLKILFTGRVWHWILTFNQSLQPQSLTLDNPFDRMEKES